MTLVSPTATSVVRDRADSLPASSAINNRAGRASGSVNCRAL
jgi:hypothetical protein